jgi:hypothetical protein
VLLKNFTDCFTWEYSEMPDLNRDLVEPRLSIKSSFRPYKQPVQNFNPVIIAEVKDEVDRLLKEGFMGVKYCAR